MNITMNLMTAIGVILLFIGASVTESTPLSSMIAIGTLGITFITIADLIRRNKI